jgi:hypothetical protein
MRTRSDRERAYRLAVGGGIVLSVAAHVVLFAFGSLVIEVRSEADRSVRLVELADPIVRDAPLEVIQLREPVISPAMAGGAAAAIPQRVASPAFASIPATVSAAIPNPLAMLQKLEEAEEAENPVASYANITDFMTDASANPRPLSANGRSSRLGPGRAQQGRQWWEWRYHGRGALPVTRRSSPHAVRADP